MMQNQQYQVNEKQVVYETFNDEILVINLDKGNYFSLRGCGSKIWTMMLSGGTAHVIAEALCQIYEADSATVLLEVQQFLQQLSQHELIVPATQSIEGIPIPAASGEARVPFEPPLIEVFVDMQDLLLLDPVHETDASGWPVQLQ